MCCNRGFNVGQISSKIFETKVLITNYALSELQNTRTFRRRYKKCIYSHQYMHISPFIKHNANCKIYVEQEELKKQYFI